MKQSLPMPVIIGVVAVVLLLAALFLYHKAGGQNGGYDKDQTRRMQEDAFKQNQGHSNTSGH